MQLTNHRLPLAGPPEFLIPLVVIRFVVIPLVVIPVMIILNVVMAMVIVAVFGPAYYDGNGFRVRGNESEQS
jgi:hypothetical protein